MKTLQFFIAILFTNLCYAQGPQFSWAKAFSQSTNTSTGIVASVAYDNVGNVYTVGNFEKTIDFDPGAGTFSMTAIGDYDVFVCKLDAAGNFVWAKQIGTPVSFATQASGLGVAIDNSQNVIITGMFTDSIDFDPGAGVHNLIAGYYKNIYLLKLNASGNFMWAKNWEGEYKTAVFAKTVSIGIDANNNIITTGNFENTTDFDPNLGVYNLTTTSTNAQPFVSKIDSNGNFVWAKTFASTGFYGGYAFSLSMDSAGNIYTAGDFKNTMDFDPSSSTFNLTAVGTYNYYVSKLDNNGNFVWAKQITQSQSSRNIFVACDNNSNVFLAGAFTGTSDFDPSAGVFNLTTSSTTTENMFICKLTSAGNFAWAKQSNNAVNTYPTITAIVANNNSLYVTGYFEDTIDFDPGAGVFNLVSQNLNDVFIEQFDSAGNFNWAKQLTSSSLIFSLDIAVDNNKNIYTGGFFQSTADFDPAVGETFNLTAEACYRGPFVEKLNECSVNNNVTVSGLTFTAMQANATYQWLKCDHPLSNAIAGATSQSYTAPGIGTYAVVVTIGSCVDTSACVTTELTGINNLENKFINIYPNPSSGIFTIEATENGTAIVTDLYGKIIADFKLLKGDNKMDLQNLASGIYFLRGINGQKQFAFKLEIEK
jgi:Secretion system C-terminal sorting domain